MENIITLCVLIIVFITACGVSALVAYIIGFESGREYGLHEVGNEFDDNHVEDLYVDCGWR